MGPAIFMCKSYRCAVMHEVSATTIDLPCREQSTELGPSRHNQVIHDGILVIQARSCRECNDRRKGKGASFSTSLERLHRAHLSYPLLGQHMCKSFHDSPATAHLHFKDSKSCRSPQLACIFAISTCTGDASGRPVLLSSTDRE